MVTVICPDCQELFEYCWEECVFACPNCDANYPFEEVVNQEAIDSLVDRIKREVQDQLTDYINQRIGEVQRRLTKVGTHQKEMDRKLDNLTNKLEGTRVKDEAILKKLARVLADPLEEELHSWLAIIFTENEMSYLIKKYNTG